MSIIQKYGYIRQQIGDEKYQAIQKYLDENPNILLSDVYYKKFAWNKFEKWYLSQKSINSKL